MGISYSKKKQLQNKKNKTKSQRSSPTSQRNNTSPKRDPIYPSEPPPSYEESEEIYVTYNLQSDDDVDKPPGYASYQSHNQPPLPPTSNYAINNTPSCSYHHPGLRYGDVRCQTPHTPNIQQPAFNIPMRPHLITVNGQTNQVKLVDNLLLEGLII